MVSNDVLWGIVIGLFITSMVDVVKIRKLRSRIKELEGK